MVGPPGTRRQDRRCEYHKDHGHDANNCYALKDHHEELVQDGRLQQHVRKNTIKTVALRQDSPPLGIIRMIYDLPTPLAVYVIQAPQKQRTPSKQPHEAPSIIFNDSDLIGVTLLHSDPLVIELHVNRFVVERVFIGFPSIV
ncbi:uncharacterized protein LOC114266716 [Camellia sinensis]|uniref:uncharacterized protein LOC114266716 n=1 Tax=Camellia sinensis TaxID=4442 RepID=UPI0010369AD6|nr:uncharacterized protein LOC114266716 [Camellia sinensis]